MVVQWMRLEQLNVQANFVPGRHYRPVDVGGGPNGFG